MVSTKKRALNISANALGSAFVGLYASIICKKKIKAKHSKKKNFQIVWLFTFVISERLINIIKLSIEVEIILD